MIHLELALRLNKISQKQLSAMADIDEPTLSKILSCQIQATEDQKNRIHATLRVRMSKEKLFQPLDLGEKAGQYISRFKTRKLAPEIQAQIDREVAEKMAELKAWQAAEPERLKLLAQKTADKYFK